MDKIDMLHSDVKDLKKDIKVILQRVSKLEVKSYLWGSLGGGVIAMLIKGLFK